MKLICVFEPFDRYTVSGIKKLTASGIDKITCLKKLVSKMNLYVTSDGIDEQIADGATFESIIEDIDMSNGDGCDFILMLKDDTKKVYIDNGYEEEEI